MNRDVVELLERQDGVISRPQVLAAGVAAHDLRRLLRRREWVVAHRGVYVAHTGPVSWRQRAWAAVLWGWPAALWGESALHALDRVEGRSTAGVIHLAVDRHRSGLRPVPGISIHHVSHLASAVQWNAGPPRTRVEDAAIDAAVSAGPGLDAVAVLARCVQRRWTTPARLSVALSCRLRVSRRAWLEAILGDLAAGTCSVLEHGFLTRVERPHRLPRAERQVPARSTQGIIYRDADYGPLLVELDGRMFHDSPTARDRDLERDLDAAVDSRASLRLGWGQVFDRPCSTAAKLATVMTRHGIAVRARPCGPSCAVR